METIRAEKLPILELSPGVRSLPIRCRSSSVSQAGPIWRPSKIEDALPSVDSPILPTRVVHLPMAIQDSAILAGIARYSETVRSTVPWVPSETLGADRYGKPSRHSPLTRNGSPHER